MRALCKETTKRYQTAAEMAADLRKTITHPRGGFVKYPPDPEEMERQREARRRKRQRDQRRLLQIGLIAGILVVLCVMMVVGWYSLGVQNHASVPDLVGMERLIAQDALEAEGLPVSVETAYSEEFEEGLVISQSREPGERVRTGTGVTIVVSAGTQWYYMEDMIGMTEADALDLLGGTGAKSVVAEYVHSDQPVGLVVGQNMEPGWQSKDSPVVIQISGQSILMPNLTGLTMEGAVALIESEGLMVGAVSEGYSADAPAHSVIAQSIAPNTEVLMGTAVDLTISQRQEEIYAPNSLFTVVVPLEDLQTEVTLTAPSGMETVAYSDVLGAGTYQIDLTSSEAGIHIVRVYLEGVLMDSAEVLFD